MWKASARVRNVHSISCRRTACCKQSCFFGEKLKLLTCDVRSFSNGGSQGKGASVVWKSALGTTLLATGAVAGGIYYANIDQKFRKSVEDKVPYSSSLFDAVLGKSEAKKPKVPLRMSQSPSNKRAENNLLPVTDATLPAKAIEEKIESGETNIHTEDLKPLAPLVNVPATVSSVDQIGVSSVDLDISKAVEKGISDSKIDEHSTPQRADVKSEISNDIASECSECEKANEVKAGKDEVPDDALEKVSEQPESTDLSPENTQPEATLSINPIDVALNTALATITDFGQKAIELHERAVTAVQHHRDSVKEALVRYEKDGVSKEDWELLNKLSESKTQALEEADQISARLTELVENVQRKITEAKGKGLESSAEVASETVAKLTYALQKVKNHLEESQAEGSVLKEFQEFVKEGKENLARELAAIRPEFDIDTLKDNADAALLAYAQKRIRLLENALREREHHEGKLLQEALVKQHREDEKLSDMKLKHELENLKTEMNNVMLQKEAEEAERHENDLRTQLRRQAAAFSDHLNNVLKVQQSELNTKHGVELREKLLLERHESELKLRGSLARINGIISAIKSKADIEKQNAEAQELWLACHSLSSALTGLGDNRTRPYPIHSEVESIRRMTNGNEVVGKVIDSLSDDVLHRGVLTEESLRQRFPNVKRVCRQVAMVGEDGGGVWTYLVSYLQSVFMFDSRVVTAPLSIDPEELDTFKILSLATYALEQGDTEQAVKYMNQLRGEPRRVAKHWIQEARLFLEAKQVSKFLTSYASAFNIGVEQHK